jgi:hypothetical protein
LPIIPMSDKQLIYIEYFYMLRSLTPTRLFTALLTH